MAMLQERYEVIGLRRERNFGGGSFLVRALKMLVHWGQICKFSFRHRGSIDLIFAENTHAFLGGILGQILRVPCVWDVEGDDRIYIRAFEKSLPLSLLLRVLHGVAHKLTTVLLVPCEEDRQEFLIRGHKPEEVVTIPLCTNLNAIAGSEERTASRKQLALEQHQLLLLYTGQRTEAPYREGAQWICQDLVEGLEEFKPQVAIFLTGRGPTFPSTNNIVTFTGFVPTIHDYLTAADICLAPIWRETGMPGKIIEYMALGKAVVLTSITRGFPHLRNGDNALIASTPEEFVDHVISLIQDPEKIARIGSAARQTAQQYYSHEAIKPVLWATIDTLV